MAAGGTARTGAGLSKFRNLPDTRAEMVSTSCSSSTITTRARRKSPRHCRSLLLHCNCLCVLVGLRKTCAYDCDYFKLANSFQ